MSFRILGLGTALPPHSMTQTEAAELARQVCSATEEQATLLKVLYRRSGVGMRYTVLPHRIALEWVEPEQEPGGNLRTLVQLGPTTQERMQFYAEHASPLALKASRTALAESAVEAAAVSHLVTVSCTGFAAPGVDLALINGLGLSPTVLRTHVGFMGCHGAINGLRVAQAFAAGDPEARILLCAVELCSLHYRFRWDPIRFIGNAIFADGAAAIVGGGRAGDRVEEVSQANGRPLVFKPLEHDGGTTSEPAWTVTATGSCLLPDSADAMTWTVGDHGFEMALSPRVPDLIKQHLAGWLADWLAGQHLALDDIGSWAVHPGGPRILLAVEQALGLDAGHLTTSREVLSEFGNMSSPTVLFILDRLRRRQAARPCVALGFGPGLVAEAALLT
ncbi:MAG: type III polyketide synthase [Pirellulales bacterium]